MRERPVFLNLLKINLPLAGFISITHRITGVVFFLGMPLLLYMYAVLPQKQVILGFVDNMWVKFFVWSLVSVYVYHFFAGLRHMVADFGHNHTLGRANSSAVVVLLLGVIFAIWHAMLIWEIWW